MKVHLPLLLRSLLLIVLALPAKSVLTWNSGSWNSTDASWLLNGEPAVFSQGDAVAFTSSASDKQVNITEQVEPASITVSGSGFSFSGNGSISGDTSLSMETGTSLTIANANGFSGGTTLADSAMLTLQAYNGVGSASSGELALGSISGTGLVVVSLQDASSKASIQGNSMESFTGTLHIAQGNVGLGRKSDHSGPGRSAILGAQRVEVGSSGTFVISLGGGSAGLVTGNSFASAVYTANGATIGNRDGHVNWLGNIFLNVQDVSSENPDYDRSAVTEMSMFYGKYVVWNGIVSGDGVLKLTSANADTGTDHRLVLTNLQNTYQGTYQVAGDYLTTLALSSSSAATAATIELSTSTSRLILMSTDAEISALNGTSGVVQAEGNGHLLLTVSSGDYAGNIRDSATPVAGLSLGLVKLGEQSLSLNGTGCAYTGCTEVRNGNVLYSGDTTLSSIAITDASARLSVSGNLTLRESSSLSFNISDYTGSMVDTAGTLSLAGDSYSVQVNGYENLTTGSYNLMAWALDSSVSAVNFTAIGLNDTAEYTYDVRVQGNALQFVVGNMGDVPWLWAGGSATWSDDSASQWANSTSSGPGGQVVTFSANNDGTVTINQVTPAGINVNSGHYIFLPDSAESIGINSSGTLKISGADTLLNLNLNNPSFTGKTELAGGILELGASNALGTSSLYFNSGLLRYGAGVSTDLSAQINAASLASVRIDSNGNDVQWADAAGVRQVLSLGVEKSGEGTLSLNWVAQGESLAGNLSVQTGVLSINKESGNGTLAGSISGAGTLELTSPSGQMTVSGNNSAFAGTLLLSGDGNASTGSVCFSSGDSFGGAGTLVKVAGQRFWFAGTTSTAANVEIVDGTTTYFDGSTNRSYTFTGAVSGSGELILKPSCNMTMSGDVSAFTGTFIHPGATAVTWLFGGDGIAGEGLVQANLLSPGTNVTYSFCYSEAVEMSGVVSGSANLRQQGSGALVLTGQNDTKGNLVIDTDCVVRLGTASSPGLWSGVNLLGSGQLTLVNGSLGSPLEIIEGVLVADVASGAGVSMAGMDGNVLQSITVRAGGLLSGISGDLSIGGTDGVQSLSLELGVSNIGASATIAPGEQYMLDIQNGVLQIADSATVTLDLESIKSILNNQRQAVYLHLSNAAIELQNGLEVSDLFANSPTSPEALGLVVLGIDGGNIVLEGAVRDVYMVMQNGDYDTVTSYSRLEPYKATFVDSGYTLSLNLPGDNTQVAWVNNLLGGGNFAVNNTNEASGVVRVLLNNEPLVEVDGVLTPEQDAQINQADTEIQGNVTAGHAVQLVKTGSGTLTVGGSLTADWLEIDEGTLQLNGTGNSVNTLHGEGNLVLSGDLLIAGNATAFQGDLSGDGELKLSGMLNGAGSVGTLQGSGQLRAVGKTFAVQNLEASSFSGSLVNGYGPGELVLQSGPGSFSLVQVQSSADWSIRNSGKLELQQSGTGKNAVLTLDSLQLLDGSDTQIIFDTDKDVSVFNLRFLKIEEGASVTLLSTGSLPVELGADGSMVMGMVETADLGNDGVAPVTLGSGTPFRGIQAAWLTVENGLLIFNSWRDERNQYALMSASRNAETGAHLLWNIPKELLGKSPDLKALTAALDAAVETGDGPAVNRLLPAAAGAGVSALGIASMGDLERQLKSIRNRTTSMGLEPNLEYDELPIFNAWANAEGDRRELKSSGADAGYILSSWGATLGFDLDFSDPLTAGFSFTGMYGDFQTNGPSSADGDVDHYYISIFGRYASNRWTHTLVGTAGWSDVSLTRRVHYNGGGYITHGNTDGNSIGVMYELGYVIPLDEDNQACIQPIMNVSYRHVSLEPYSESGSDAALHFGGQDLNAASFGLGARAQTYALENVLNRSSILEARMLLKADAGDTRSVSQVSLLRMRERSGRVRSAESGRVGMEVGAGFTVPVGAGSGFIFLDAGFEFRADETEWNGTAGYRMSF